MSERMERRAHAPARWVRACALSALAAFVLAACGGGGGGAPKPPVTVASLDADALSVTAGTQGVALHATASDPSARIFWSLDGPGELRDGADQTTKTYVPPGQEFLDDAATATVTVQAGSDRKSLAIALAPTKLAGHAWVQSHPVATRWNQVAYGGGAFLAVSSYGPTYRSVDGATWTPIDGNPVGGLSAVGWGDAGWVGVTGAGAVATSLDGLTWNVGATVVPGAARVVFGNGRYLITVYNYATAEASVMTSANGVDWTSAPSDVTAATAGKGLFVAVGRGGIETSVDGLTWTVVPGTPTWLDGIAYGNDLFVAASGGTVLTSTDGVTWTTPAWAGLQSGTNLGFAAGLFYTSADHGIMTSADGETWSLQASPDTLQGLGLSVTEHDGLVVAVSELGMLETSRDFATWDEIFHGNIGNLTAVAYTPPDFGQPGAYVAVSDQGGTLRSTDTARWTRGQIADGVAARAVIHVGSVWVAVGTQANAGDGATGLAWISVDGLSWVPATLPDATQPLSGLAFDGTRLVAIGSRGAVLTSAHGDQWDAIASLDGAAPKAITFAAGKFVVVGADGFAATSTDAVHWAVAAQLESVRQGRDGAPVALVAVTWDGQRFITVGDNGDTATSTDGLAWTVGNLGLYADSLGGVASSGAVTVAVFGPAQLFTSVDGVTWRDRENPALPNYAQHAVIFAAGRFVAVGDGGQIVTSGP
jgi:hypothetical protein